MYDHFIAIDWAQANMALARMSKISEKITTHEGPADISGIQIYLKNLKGSKILTLEESTGFLAPYIVWTTFNQRLRLNKKGDFMKPSAFRRPKNRQN